MTDRAPGAPRLLTSALAGSTLPMVVLGSAALTAPANASAPAPRAATPSAVHAAQTQITQDLGVRALTSVKTPAARGASAYTVKRGDTLSHIAARHNVSLSTLLRANGLSLSSIIHPGQVLKLSAGSSTSGSSSSSSKSSGSTATYTVRPGDTLSHIAARYKVSVSTLQSANGLGRSSLIHPGQVLKLSGKSSSSSASSSSGSSSSSSRPASAASYTVQRGDTLSHIAARHKVSLNTLLSANGLSRTSVIHPGQVLKLSGSTSSSSGGSSSSSSQEQLVPSTFLHYRYPAHVVASANENKRKLLASPIPTRSQTEALIRDTARRMGVDPRLALGHAMAESSLNHASVSPANAIGTMQVIPSSGEWASQMVGRKLNLLDPQDNVTAGVAIIRHLQRTSSSLDIGIASYYQGAAGVKRNGMYPDTKQYVAKVKRYMQQF